MFKKNKKRSWLKDLFIPHEHNNHQPKALQHKALFAYSVVLIAIKVALIGAQVLLPSASLYSSAITRNNIFELTNASRRNAGLEKLEFNERLNVAAQRKAEDMFVNQYFAHTSPEGLTAWNFIHNTGYEYHVAGENLAVYYQEAEDVLAGWMASPSHKKNIIDKRFTQIGVGVATGTFDGYKDSIIVVQMFGLPLDNHVTESDFASISTHDNISDPNDSEAVETKEVDLVSLSPSENGLEVTVSTSEANEVEANLNETSQLLKKIDDQTWSGEIATESLVDDVDGADLFIQVFKEDQPVTTETVAWVAGTTDTRDVYYVDTNSKSTELFGVFRVSGLEDIVTRFYFLTIVFLAAALMVNILVRFEVQKHSTTAHVLVVISIAALLAFL